MRRLMLAAAIALAGLFLPALASASTGSAYLRGLTCRPSLDPSKRVVSITAVMDTIPTTEHLRIRFGLTQRVGDSVAQVHAGDLGKWISPSSPTLGQRPSDQWIVNHPVIGVPVPGNYRFHVSFEWIGSGGQLLARQSRTSETCHQPDMRPDLSVRLVQAQSVTGGEQYQLKIANSGMTGAENVQLLFAPGGGAESQTVTIPRVRAHRAVYRSFTGPVCTGSSSSVNFTADPADLIDVISRSNDSLTVACDGS